LLIKTQSLLEVCRYETGKYMIVK